MTKPPHRTRNPQARAVFNANKTRIREMLDQDRLMTEIFAELKFPGSYTQFTRYCAKWFKPAAPPAPSKAPATARPIELATVEAVTAPAEPPSPIRPAKPQVPEWNPAKLRRADVLRPRTDEQ